MIRYVTTSLLISEFFHNVLDNNNQYSRSPLMFNHTHMQFHAWLSMITVAVLTVAGLLALSLALQERLLRSKYAGAWVQKLPPLETMEAHLFLVNRCGFILLTSVIVTSFYFYHTLLWQQPMLLPKTLLAVTAWLIFLILLLGRHWRGWRGAQAINSTLCGVILLIVIYLVSNIELI